jgi:hypothetical protein
MSFAKQTKNCTSSPPETMERLSLVACSAMPLVAGQQLTKML